MAAHARRAADTGGPPGHRLGRPRRRRRTNALFASAGAYAYLVADGLKGVTSPEQVRDLARLVKSGEATVDDIAAELRRWCE